MPSGIYCIENLINGKKYIGQSGNLNKRISEFHDGCLALVSALEYYGKENFVRHIVEECLSEELDEKEKFYIKEFHSHYTEWGYNISWGGEGVMRGRKHTEETKEKIGNKNKGSKRTPEQRAKISETHKGLLSGSKHPMFGKKHSEDAKRKMSEAGQLYNYNRGRSFSESTKEKISKTKKEKGSNRLEKNSRFGKKEESATSKFHGISLNVCKKKSGKSYYRWFARAYTGYERIFLGSFEKEEDAARAYDEYVVENNLPNPLNFPEEYER
jgi:group I intron endonuclease